MADYDTVSKGGNDCSSLWQSLPASRQGRLGGILQNSRGISVLFLVIAMLLMVTIGYVFSYLIPTKQKSVALTISSNQAFFLAQSGVEFAVRLAKDNGWTTPALLNANLNLPANNTRSLGAGRFTLTYTNTAPNLDTLLSVGEVPPGTERRRIVVTNFTSFLNYFTYRRPITIQANQVTTGPLTNFPMLVSVTNASLATVANGGRIASYDVTTNDPRDLIFQALDDTTCGGAGTSPCRLSHEIELYNPATGQLIAWVRVPSINNNIVFYMYYGNSCMTASTQNPSGVWADYRGVWHSRESSTPLTDSTGNNHLTTNSTQVAGQIGNAQSYNGTSQLASKTSGVVNIPASNASQTISVWFTIGVADGNTRSGVSFVNPTGGGSAVQFGQRSSAVCFWRWGGTVLGGTQANPTVNTWNYMVYTFDGTTHRPYYNGTALTTATTAPQTGTPTGIYFSTWNGTGEPWNGRIDEVRISNIVRSAGWIATEYRNQNAPGTFSILGAEENI